MTNKEHLIRAARAFMAHFNPSDLAEGASQQWQSLEHICNVAESDEREEAVKEITERWLHGFPFNEDNDGDVELAKQAGLI